MSIEPVRKQVVVNASQEHCFKVFTEGLDRWWPRQHHIGTTPMKKAVLETKPGGRWYAISEDGSECDTGRVLTWDPPRRLVLSWQINAQWKFDPDFMTEIELLFVAEGPKKTLVTMEHRHLDAYGPAAAEIRKSISAPTGWPAIVETFALEAEKA